MPTFKARSIPETLKDMAVPAVSRKETPIQDAIVHYGQGLDALAQAKNCFYPVAKPKAGDWLADQQEDGQSFRSFLRGAFKAEPHASFNTINLVIVGEGITPSVAVAIKEFTEAYYLLPVRIVGPIPLKDIKSLKMRVNESTGQRQLFCNDIMDHIQSHVCRDRQYARSSVCTIAVTMEDLVNREDWNFVYGLASLTDGTGVFSLFRYSPAFNGETSKSEAESQAIILRRACKVICHELGHIFGLRHCINFTCLMNGANHVGELERQPPIECPACTKKLEQSFGWNLLHRYKGMAPQLQKVGFTEDYLRLTQHIIPTFEAAVSACGEVPASIGKKYLVQGCERSPTPPPT